MVRTSRRGRLAVGVAALVVALIAAACGSDGDSDADGGDSSTTKGEKLRVGVGQAWASFNPHDPNTTGAGSGDTTYLRPVYDTLVDTSAFDGTIEPALATSWKLEGLVLTFELRDNVKFTDGSTFDAEVAKANLDAGAAVRLAQLRAGDAPPPTATVVDANTVTLTFAEAIANPVPQYGGKGGMMVAISGLDDPDALARNPVGSGQYIYDQSASSDQARYVYRSNPDYWNPDAQHFENMELFQFTDTSAQQNALRSGEVNVATLDPSFAISAEGAGYALVTASKSAWFLDIQDLNGTLVPAFANVKARQAIAYAIDREGFVDAITQGFGEPSSQPYTTESEWYVPALADVFEFDQAKAKSLLSDAGYPNGFSFEAPADSATSTALTAIQGMLGDVGITMELKLLDTASFNPTSGKYPVFMAPFPATGSPAATFGIFLGSSPLNAFDVSQPELEDLITEINATSDKAKNKELNDQLLEELINSAQFVVASTVQAIAAHDDTVTNVTWSTGDPNPNILSITPVLN